jgi:hypothetical protein
VLAYVIEYGWVNGCTIVCQPKNKGSLLYHTGPHVFFRATVGENGNSSFDLIVFGKNLAKQVELSIMNWACFKPSSKYFSTAFGSLVGR